MFHKRIPIAKSLQSQEFAAGETHCPHRSPVSPALGAGMSISSRISFGHHYSLTVRRDSE